MSPTWELFVGVRSALIDTSWGTIADFNGDGLVDLAVGAPYAATNTGRVHIYFGTATGLNVTPTASLMGPSGGIAFGSSMASGDVNGDGYTDLAVEVRESISNMGRLHLYFGSATGLGPTPSLSLTVPDDIGTYGDSVASVGDLNGDGYSDVAVGTSRAMSSTGRVHVYLGSSTGLRATPAFSLMGLDGGDSHFGNSVAGVGDVNGDGYADLAVGAPGAMSYQGRVHIYLGSATGLRATPAFSLMGPDGGNGSFGNSVASAGDVNGDGYADLAVGALGVMSFQGRVHVYLGSSTGLSAVPSYSITGPDGVNGSFSYSLAGAGDVNGDGYGDLAVGAPNAMAGGRVHVYLGSATGLGPAPSGSLAGADVGGGALGRTLARAGDVNGDGYADLAAGAPYAGSQTGRLHIYFGSARGLSPSPSVSLIGPDGGSGSFSTSVASVSDVTEGGCVELTAPNLDTMSSHGVSIDVSPRMEPPGV